MVDLAMGYSYEQPTVVKELICESWFFGLQTLRKNVIFKRVRFNRRNQLPDESVEEYITVLHQLVNSCDYGNFRDEMLRDRLVVGIRDMAL